MDNEELLGSEYNNLTDLMGIDTDHFNNLLGRIARLPKEKQAAAVRSVMNKPAMTISGHSSRSEMEMRFAQLPKEIRDGLIKKRLQLADTRFYIVKEIGGKTQIDIFQGTDAKNVGLANLANQKLEKDNWFILSAIRMNYAVFAADAKEFKERADFTHIVPIIRNGEFELEAGNKKLIGLMSNDAFDTRERTDLPIGQYKIESTKIIEPQVEIKMPVKFAAGADPNTLLRVVFIGTSVIPY